MEPMGQYLDQKKMDRMDWCIGRCLFVVVDWSMHRRSGGVVCSHR